jgi:hypothetical protein
MAEQVALALIDGKISQIPATDTIRGAGAASSYQKYKVAPLETYTIPDGISSVITGNMEIEGILVLEGRLEIL